MTDVKEWLQTVYGNSEGWLTLCYFRNRRLGKIQWLRTSDLDALPVLAENARETWDVYLSVATYRDCGGKDERGSEADAISIPGFWADIDIGTEGHKDGKLPNPPDEAAALSIIGGLPEPSAVVHTGGGLHVWWFFDAPWVFDDWRQAAAASKTWQDGLIARAADRGYHLDQTGDLARILRLPDTVNRKVPDNPRPVVLREMSDRRYPVEALMPDMPEVTTQSSVASSDIRDELSELLSLSWDEILLPHGATFVRRRESDGAGLWCRPGKDPSEGISFTTDANGVPTLVNFSSSWDALPVGSGQKLTKFRVWAHLNHGGDYAKAEAALRGEQSGSDKLRERFAKFAGRAMTEDRLFSDQEESVDWLIPPLVERGCQVAIYSREGQGKSLFALDLAMHMAVGRDWETGSPGDRLRVVYVDIENTEKLVRERIRHMGYTRGDRVSHALRYYPFPDLGWLDTQEGGLDLLSIAVYEKADLVIIDTLSRVVEGEENCNDTFHNFYKYTGRLLKERGIALIRLDHAGKDLTKGMRGASSKGTDLDVVWQLTVQGDVVTLDRVKDRTNHVPDRLQYQRCDGPLRHEPLAPGQGYANRIDAIAAELDRRAIPVTDGIRKTWDAINPMFVAGSPVKYAELEAAVKKRREFKDIIQE